MRSISEPTDSMAHLDAGEPNNADLNWHASTEHTRAEQGSASAEIAQALRGLRADCDAANLEPGSTVAGRFLIVRRLSHGSFGIVYEALDRASHDRPVALKLARGHIDERAAESFRQEARLVAQLSHAAIVTLYDSGLHEGRPYLVLERLEGATLKSRLDQGPLDVRSALRIGKDLARGLVAAHEAGVMHLDIKPSNLFLTEAGHAKILDFGLGSVVGETASAGGTRAYAPPEQRARRTSRKNDVYSAAATLAHSLTGKIPKPIQAFRAARLGTPPPSAPEAESELWAPVAPEPARKLLADLRRAKVPFGLRRLIVGALSEVPDKRPDARSWLQGLERVERSIQQTRGRAILLAIAIVGSLLVALFLALRADPNARERAPVDISAPPRAVVERLMQAVIEEQNEHFLALANVPCHSVEQNRAITSRLVELASQYQIPSAQSVEGRPVYTVGTAEQIARTLVTIARSHPEALTPRDEGDLKQALADFVRANPEALNQEVLRWQKETSLAKRNVALKLSSCGVLDAQTQASAQQQLRQESPPSYMAQGLDRARRGGLGVVLVFRAAWCAACVQIERQTLSNTDVREAMKGRVELVTFDATNDEDPEVVRVLERYQVRGLPTMIRLDREGKELQRLTDYVGVPEMLSFIQR
jgi:serine/threonine protein kinase